MTYDEDEFDLDDMQVPVDSTWVLDKSLEISEEGDSLWTLIAEKHFASVVELNYAYKNHKGLNEGMSRYAVFSKKFRWFNTTFYFSENIDKAIDGYPPEDFFEEEYLNLFYMPEKIFNDFRYGKDSLRYKAMHDTLEDIKEDWIGRCLVKGAIIELDSLLEESGDKSISIETFWEREEELAEVILDVGNDELAIDTVFGDGFYNKNRALIDSSLSKLEDKIQVYVDAASYLVQTKMPGELVGTNGYIDTDGAIIWKVDGDVMLSKDYSMWAESTVSNKWAWIVSIVFLLFVLTGLISRLRKR